MSYSFYEAGTAFDPAAPLAFDTETEYVPDLRGAVPRLALAAASDGERVVLVHPGKLVPFLRAHPNELVCHNVAFDFWVVHEALPPGDRGAWWARADAGRVWDTMLMDGLWRIATGQQHYMEKVFRRTLGQVAAALGCPVVPDKGSDYRLRFGELFSLLDYSFADPGFFEYASQDVVATRWVFDRLLPELLRADADALAQAGPELLPGRSEYGPQTHHLQVKASISLSRVSHHGLPLNQKKREAQTASLKADLDLRLEAYKSGEYAGLVETDPLGNFLFSEKNGVPLYKQGYLGGKLRDAALRLGIAAPLSAKGNSASTAWEDWADYEGKDPFVDQHIRVNRAVKLLRSYDELKDAGDAVHTSYNILARSGRVTSEKPNVQNYLRDGPFRGLFEARPGYVMMTADYSFVELRTFAAVCERRYGGSAMADVIRAGRDPHSHTAALISGLPYDHVAEWSSVPDGDGRRLDPRYKTAKNFRQSAKVGNFGIIGGLGPKKLAALGRSQYGLKSMTTEDGKKLRDRICNEVYPEMRLYLQDDAARNLAWRLRLPYLEVLRRARWLGGSADWRLKDAEHWLAMGTPRYPPFLKIAQEQWEVYGAAWSASQSAVFRRFWEWVESRADPHTAALVRRILDKGAVDPDWEDSEGESSKYLPDGEKALRREAFFLPGRLFLQDAWTLTGRLRACCGYTQAKNSQFQGLAADGVKLAVWRLVRQGFRVVNQVHDEVLTELPEGQAQILAPKVAEIMERSMEEVMGGTLPAKVEWSLGPCWAKG